MKVKNIYQKDPGKNEMTERRTNRKKDKIKWKRG